MNPNPNDPELARIAASLAIPELRQAALAQQQGRSAEAKKAAERFLEQEPSNLLAMTIAAEAALHLGDLVQSERVLRQVVERAPFFFRASLLLGRTLAADLRLKEAIEVIEVALKNAPDQTPILRYLAQLLADTGKVDRAVSIYRKIIAANEPLADDRVTYAHYLRIAGSPSDSIAALRGALKIDSAHGGAWWALAHYFPSALDQADRDTIHAALRKRGAEGNDAGLLHVALSILADREGDYELAFHELTIAKGSRKNLRRYDPQLLAQRVEKLVASFPLDLFAARQSEGSSSDAPIFVVGLPRSGSTLVERILGCHSKIESAGELPIMPVLIDQLRQRTPSGQDYAELMPPISDDQLKALAEWYLDRSRNFRHTKKPHFIDKLNQNWLHVGLIRLILPKAKIIDVRRNPLDCCWSNYRMLFADDYANHLADTAHYYREYVRMIEAIDIAAPGGILTVLYETLVDDLEGQTQRMLAFLGLEMEPNCLTFHLSQDRVATPSSEQVKRPLNREGIGSANPYRRWLQPLIDALGPLSTKSD